MSSRFFIDHGAIHDRKTGQHVGMQAEIDWQQRLFKLLCELDDVASPAAPDDAKQVPFCWVIPGDDTANMNGFIDAHVSNHGEFTKPLYEHPPKAPDDGKGQPVAWMTQYGDDVRTVQQLTRTFPFGGEQRNQYCIPLYSNPAPQGWQQGAAREILKECYDGAGYVDESVVAAIITRHQEGK